MPGVSGLIVDRRQLKQRYLLLLERNGSEKRRLVVITTRDSA
jgi:hypothetical protein